MNRPELLHDLTMRILALGLLHPARVGIDGVDAAGKTTLANELAQALSALTGRQIIRASIDGFHNPRVVRLRQGSDSPEGYFADSFNLRALQENLLGPLGADAAQRVVRTAVFDVLRDSARSVEPIQAADDAILIFDGIFLHRPELAGAWDLSIFLQVSFDTVLARAAQRDHERASIGDAQAIIDRYHKRYIPAQQHYLRACQPEQRADLVIDNNDPQHPVLLHEAG